MSESAEDAPKETAPAESTRVPGKYHLTMTTGLQGRIKVQRNPTPNENKSDRAHGD